MSFYLTAFIENSNPKISKSNKAAQIDICVKSSIVKKSIIDCASTLGVKITKSKDKLHVFGINNIYLLLITINKTTLLNIKKWEYFFSFIESRYHNLKESKKARFTQKEINLINKFHNVKIN